MDYEKKYKETLERAKEKYAMFEGMKQGDVLEDVFPELKKPEDEEIRKEIMQLIQGMHDADPRKERWLAWLEKQGENNKWKPSKDEMDALYGLAYITNKMDDKKDEAITKLYQDLKKVFFSGVSYENMFPSSPIDAPIKLEKQGEQNPIMAKSPQLEEQKPVEHFELKAGHWYICHRAYCCRADHLTVKEGERFMCEKDGIVKGFVIKEPAKYFKECNAPAPMEDDPNEVRRRSTIQVLEYARSIPDYNQFGIDDINKNIAWVEKRNSNEDNANKAYWRDYWEGKQEVLDKYAELEKQEEQKPQRIISAEAKEAMYGKPTAWSEEDEERLKETLAIIDTVEDINKAKDGFLGAKMWLKSLKDRVGCEANCTTTKEWREEDEQHIDSLLKRLDGLCRNEFERTRFAISEDRDFLKSLKQRYTWKPSEEQIEALKAACDEHWEPDGLDPLYTLYQELKKR